MTGLEQVITVKARLHLGGGSMATKLEVVVEVGGEEDVMESGRL